MIGLYNIFVNVLIDSFITRMYNTAILDEADGLWCLTIRSFSNHYYWKNISSIIEGKDSEL